MARRSVLTQGMLIAALLVVAAAAFYAGVGLRATLNSPTAAAWADEAPVYTGPTATAEQVVVGGEEQGIVTLGDNQAMQIQTTVGGETGYQRAVTVASRLNEALTAGVHGADIAAQEVEGAWVIMAGTTSLITVNAEEANRWGIAPVDLADIWVGNLRTAVEAAWGTASGGEQQTGEQQTGEQQTGEQQTGEQQTGEQQAGGEQGDWQPPEPYKDKVVPIISAGEGLRLGIARINGPQSAVSQVQAVAQVEAKYQDLLDIEVYVPISTAVPGRTLARVQGVGVTGVGDLRIK